MSHRLKHLISCHQHFKTQPPAEHKPAAVVCCMDCRCPPELILQQQVGDLYALRSAGPVINDTVVECLELLVEREITDAIVLMTHTDCAAMKAYQKPSTRSALPSTCATIHETLASYPADTPWELDTLLAQYSKALIPRLLNKSPLIQSAHHQRGVALATGIYQVEHQRIQWLSAST